MDLTIHIALYKSCLVSSTLSCTYENIDIPVLYFRCFVSLTRSYENIDIPLSFMSHDTGSKRRRRGFRD